MKTNTNKNKGRKTLLIPLIMGILICLNMVLVLADEPYYNMTSSGKGFEGILDYDNNLVDGYFVIAFLAFIWVVVYVVMEKAGFNEPTGAAFAFFLSLITSFIFALFTTVATYAIFLLALGLAGSIFWLIIKGRE